MDGAICGEWAENTAKNFVIENNILDRSAYRMIHLVAREEASVPKLSGNTYIQHLSGMLGHYGANRISEPEMLMFDENAEDTIKNVLGDKTAKVYVIK